MKFIICIETGIFHLEDKKPDLVTKKNKVRLSSLDVREILAGVLPVGLGNQSEKLVEPPLAHGVKILDVAWNHRGHNRT